MKKLYLVLIIVFPLAMLNGQTLTENYIHNTSYNAEYREYGNATITVTAADLLDNNANFSILNQVGGLITIANGIMSLELQGDWSPGYALKTGLVKDLNLSFDIPDLELGELLTDSGNTTGFYAKTENNKLLFSSPYIIRSIDNFELNAQLPSSFNQVEYSNTFNDAIYNCDDNYGDNSSLGSVIIHNSVLSFSLLAQSYSSCFFKLGQIFHLQTVDLPDMELGNITYENGDASPYKVKVENNWIVFYTDQNIPSYTKNLNFLFTTNLPYANIAENKKIQNITYFDQLGRQKQDVAIKAGGGDFYTQAKDIIGLVEYDDFGRQTKQYLPYASNSLQGNIHSNALSSQAAFYNTLKYEHTLNPYEEKLIETSPLARVFKQGAPGTDWQINYGTNTDHSIKFKYQTNVTNEVKKFTVSHPNNDKTQIQLIFNNYYDVNALYKNIIKDENWQPNQTYANHHTTEEFKDKSGRVLLKRTYALTSSTTSEAHDTYYIYDDYGNLTYVLPPKASGETNMTQDLLNKLCYQYKYDHRNRLVEKKVAGKGWEYIVYDQLNRPVLTQDANLRLENKWLFTKYDALGRITYTGIYSSGGDTRVSMQNTINNNTVIFEHKEANPQLINGTTLFYSNDVFPDDDVEVLTANYYDDYEIGNQITLNPANGSWPWEGMEISLATKGLPTISRVKVLGTNDWITSATYYDEKGRPWQSHVKNDFLNTQDWILSKLDFVANIEKSITVHIKGGSNITTTDSYSYDHMNRLLTHKQKIGNQEEEVIVSNTYDELGQLISKGVGGKTTQNRLQEINYTYNIRGWLTKINKLEDLGNDLFSFKINYNTTEMGGNNTPLFNGNISETLWKTTNDISSNGTEITRGYSYNYDNLNRLKKGDYALSYGQGNYSFSSGYEMGIGSYDQNGNIISLNREVQKNGYQVIDQYGYSYVGNQLTDLNITDSYNFEETREYTYDLNGNLAEEFREYDGGNNGEEEREINYNHLNLPILVTILRNGIDPYDQQNQVQVDGSISYTYDALGNKIQKKVDDGNSITITNYAGNYIYENDELKFFSHPEGYIEPVFTSGGATISSYDYTYQYKDHLGNIRLSYQDLDENGIIDSSTEIKEENNYYPFGLKHKGYNSSITGRNHTYGYNGVEESNELGLNVLEMDMRHYDAAIARWVVIDPVTHHNFSPYQAFDNNPVFWTDPSGADSEMSTSNVLTTLNEPSFFQSLFRFSQLEGINTYTEDDTVVGPGASNELETVYLYGNKKKTKVNTYPNRMNPMTQISYDFFTWLSKSPWHGVGLWGSNKGGEDFGRKRRRQDRMTETYDNLAAGMPGGIGPSITKWKHLNNYAAETIDVIQYVTGASGQLDNLKDVGIDINQQNQQSIEISVYEYNVRYQSIEGVLRVIDSSKSQFITVKGKTRAEAEGKRDSVLKYNNWRRSTTKAMKLDLRK